MYSETSFNGDGCKKNRKIVFKQKEHTLKLHRTDNTNIMVDDKKFILIQLIKKEPVIWDKNHVLHYNPNAIAIAWNRVSAEMPLMPSTHECRALWRSVRDALRYQQRRLQISRNRGCKGQVVEKNELIKLLSFLNKNDPKSSPSFDGESHVSSFTRDLNDETCDYASNENTRLVECSIQSGSPCNHYSKDSNKIIKDQISMDVNEDTYDSLSNGNTSLAECFIKSSDASNQVLKEHKKVAKDRISSSVQSISLAINKLVDGTTLERETQQTTPHPFKYEYVWRLLENLYSQMDESSVNKINQQIINIAYDNCKKSDL